jgi:hypothetical protein
MSSLHQGYLVFGPSEALVAPLNPPAFDTPYGNTYRAGNVGDYILGNTGYARDVALTTKAIEALVEPHVFMARRKAARDRAYDNAGSAYNETFQVLSTQVGDFEAKRLAAIEAQNTLQMELDIAEIKAPKSIANVVIGQQTFGQFKGTNEYRKKKGKKGIKK